VSDAPVSASTETNVKRTQRGTWARIAIPPDK
jgi:hypothetical protein